MESIFNTVKKKRNLHRLSALWLFLVVVELFCPAFCDVRLSAAETDFTPSETGVSFERRSRSPETSVAVGDYQNRHHETSNCQDECLCHATAIPNLGVFTHRESVAHSETIIFDFIEPVLNSLPPPDQPPKLS